MRAYVSLATVLNSVETLESTVTPYLQVPAQIGGTRRGLVKKLQQQGSRAHGTCTATSRAPTEKHMNSPPAPASLERAF